MSSSRIRARARAARTRRTVRLALLSAVAAVTTVGLTVSAPSAHPVPRPAPSPADDGFRSLVVGGTEASQDAYPFMAALLRAGEGNHWERQYCGGSLIAADTVLTAGHCAYERGVLKKPEEIDVVVGRTTLSHTDEGQERDVKSISVHPRYGNSSYDAAVLELGEPVTGIAPVRLPTKGTDGLIQPGSRATVIGWGSTDVTLPHSPDRLRQVDVPILANAECRTNDGGFDPDVEICAGQEGRDACFGDSGGPLLRTVPGREEYFQVGIVSRGASCGDQGTPTLYTYTGSAALWDTWPDRP